MAVTEQTPINTSLANGVTTVFPYGFLVIRSEDLKVQVGIALQTEGVDYTVTGIGVASGGDVTFTAPPADGSTVLIYRSSKIKRETDYQDNGDLPASTVNLDFDRLWLVMQELFAGLFGDLPTPGDASTLRGELANSSDSAMGAGIPGYTRGLPYRADSVGGALNEAGAFDPEVNYAVNTLGWADLQGMINIGWFVGADNTGANDMTSIMVLAHLLGPNIYAPDGTWAMNWVPTTVYRVHGSGKTFIKAFDTASAAITDRVVMTQWSYQRGLSNLTLIGTGLVGVGFTFGCTNPNDFTAGDQLMNNVRFRAVSFQGLEKGFQAPSGNIGCSFYDCSWQGNKYGIYALNNKFSASPMHAGNKYFFGCHMEFNYCGVYIHNTQAGFGGINFSGIIFENNAIHAYIYATDAFIPVELGGFWNELGGTLSTLGLANVTLDQWTGSVKSTAVFPSRAFIFDGSNCNYHINGGRVTDIRLKATNSTINAYGSVCEKDAGVGARPCTVDDANSIIRMIDCDTDYGFPTSARCIVTGSPSTRRFTIGAADAATRWWLAPHRTAGQQSAVAGSAVSLSCKLTTQRDLGLGSFNVAGVVVSDGVIYPKCNEYTAPFASTADVTKLLISPVTTTAGWYVATVMAKTISGSPVFSVWDRSTAQMAFAMKPPTTGQWHTLAAMGYSPGGQTLWLDCGCDVAGAAVFRLQAYQMIRFDTKSEAQAFLASGCFAAPLVLAQFGNTVGAVANGASVTVPMAGLAGAAVGDYVTVSPSIDLQGLTLTGYVSAANTVQLVFSNQTGGLVTLGAGFYYIEIRQS